MTPSLQTLYGLVMIAIGSFKTWLHMGSVPILSLPTCTGKTLTLAVGPTGFFEQAHCWGCYMLAAGIALTVFALYRNFQKRRSVAPVMD